MKPLLTIIAVLSMASCVQTQSPQLNTLELEGLKAELATLRIDVAAQKDEHVALNGRLKAIEDRGLPASTVFLDPAGGGGYGVLNAGVAPILVSFIDSAPIGDGTKVRLKIGNTTSATFNGVDLSINYNRRLPSDGDGFATWSEGLRTAAARIPTALAPGSWTVVSASLPDIKPDSLGYLVVSAKLDSVALRTSN